MVAQNIEKAVSTLVGSLYTVDVRRRNQLCCIIVFGIRRSVGRWLTEHPHKLESWYNLIELYEAWNKPEEDKEWRAKLPQAEAADE